jgi:RNA polymerase primary sigma factor
MAGLSERLADFTASSRFHAVDPKGDTSLHLAARTGNLALCDLFIRAGANPGSLNHEGQTPADVAFAEGHNLVAQLLSSLAAKPLDTEPDDTLDEILHPDASGETVKATLESPAAQIKSIELNESLDDIGELLSFEAEKEPEEFFGQSATETASGTFVALVRPSPAFSTDEGEDWELDFSAAQIAGDGIGTETSISPERGGDKDFLKVRSRGRLSVKRAVVQPGTRLSIDPEICMTWAEDALAKGWVSPNDIETLVALCEGNGDPEELRANLECNLEAAGFDVVDQASEYGGGLWDSRSHVSLDELAEAIEAVFTRAIPLPGTRRFFMDKSEEMQLLEPMTRAKQKLQLGILACEVAVETILEVVDQIRGGSVDPGSVTLRSILPARVGHIETAEFFAAAEALKHWHANGRVMDGKRRREALSALEALDLSMAFQRDIVKSLEESEANVEDATRLDGHISVFEVAAEQLILEHLPYARRVASRNVEVGEDPEDVFQVAFMGLQRSTRRFDPDRGIRFVGYCAFWIKQALTRWRADEGAAIRVPVHRHETLAKLDRALESLDVRADGAVSDADLAAELGWTNEEVRQLRRIPRLAEYPEDADAWDDLLPELEIEDPFDQAETARIVDDALAELQERHADVIRMRFGIGRDREMTLEEIGQLYGVTRERIRQIEAKALDLLSHPGRKRRLQEMLGM